MVYSLIEFEMEASTVLLIPGRSSSCIVGAFAANPPDIGLAVALVSVVLLSESTKDKFFALVIFCTLDSHKLEAPYKFYKEDSILKAQHHPP